MRERRSPRRLAPRAVLIDSSAMYALSDPSDRHHQAAIGTLNWLLGADTDILTTNFLLAEANALIVNRMRRPDTAVEFLNQAYGAGGYAIIHITEADEIAALRLLNRYRDKFFSFTDATSFVVMERLGIRHAFTFDADFRQYGWLVVGSDPA
jgi:uncharacterized protein